MLMSKSGTKLVFLTCFILAYLNVQEVAFADQCADDSPLVVRHALTKQTVLEVRDCISVLSSEVEKYSEANKNMSFEGIPDFLETKNAKVKEAHQQLLQMGPKIAPELCKYLDRFNGDRWENVARRILIELDCRSSVLDALVRHDIRPAGYANAVDLLIYAGMFDQSPLLKLLKSADSRLRMVPINVICNFDGMGRSWNSMDWYKLPFSGISTAGDAVDALGPVVLSEPDETMRKHACYALGRLWTLQLRTIEFLQSSLYDMSGATPKQREKLLAEFKEMLRTQKISHKIAGYLGQVLLHDKSDKVRETSLYFLGYLPEEDAATYVIAAQTEGSDSIKLPAAIECFSFSRDESTQNSLKLLREVLLDPGKIVSARDCVMRMIRMRRYSYKAVPLLLEAARQTEDDEFRQQIARVFVSIPPVQAMTEAVPQLLDWLEGKDNILRSYSKEALSRISSRMTPEQKIRFEKDCKR